MFCIKKIKRSALAFVLQKSWIFKLNQNGTHIEHRPQDRSFRPFAVWKTWLRRLPMLLLTLIFCERYRVIAPSHFLCMQLTLVSVSCIDPDQFSMNHVFSPEMYDSAAQKIFYNLSLIEEVGTHCCWGHIKQSFLLFPALHNMNTSMMIDESTWIENDQQQILKTRPTR